MLFSYLKSKNRKGKAAALSVLCRGETYDSPKTQGLHSLLPYLKTLQF